MGLTFKEQKIVGILFIIYTIYAFIYSMELHMPGFFSLILITCIISYTLVIRHIVKRSLFFKKVYLIYLIYSLYILFQFIHGIFNSSSYWQFKALIFNTLILYLPLLTLLFSHPTENIGILRTWNTCIHPKYPFLYLLPLVTFSIQFCFGPAYFLYAVFWFWLPKKWKFSVGIIILLMLVGNLEDRSQVLKGTLALLLCGGIFMKKIVHISLLHLAHWGCYILAIILLILGLTGKFNIFSPDTYEGEREIESNQAYDPEKPEEEENLLTVDTRTALYYETIMSAIENNYVIFGRSPGRGNDTKLFSFISESIGESDVERVRNEICHINIFTWTGIVGVVIYLLLYLQASFLALYRSKNIYVKYLSVLIAFHWAYGWVEDINDINMMNVGLWLMIGICVSPYFRNMGEREFELWFKSIFISDMVTPYHKFILNKELKSLKSI